MERKRKGHKRKSKYNSSWSWKRNIRVNEEGEENGM